MRSLRFCWYPQPPEKKNPTQITHTWKMQMSLKKASCLHLWDLFLFCAQLNFFFKSTLGSWVMRTWASVACLECDLGHLMILDATFTGRKYSLQDMQGQKPRPQIPHERNAWETNKNKTLILLYTNSFNETLVERSLKAVGTVHLFWTSTSLPKLNKIPHQRTFILCIKHQFLFPCAMQHS